LELIPNPKEDIITYNPSFDLGRGETLMFLARTNKYIIEAKTSVGAIRSSQIDKLTNPLHPNFFNHEGRQIIYYLENPNPSGPKQLENLRLLEEKGVKIISSPEELRGLFQP
jgi:hypothetical protein